MSITLVPSEIGPRGGAPPIADAPRYVPTLGCGSLQYEKKNGNRLLVCCHYLNVTCSLKSSYRLLFVFIFRPQIVFRVFRCLIPIIVSKGLLLGSTSSVAGIDQYWCFVASNNAHTWLLIFSLVHFIDLYFTIIFFPF